MDPVLIGVIFLFVLTAMLMSGIRIAYATALCGFVWLFLLRAFARAPGSTRWCLRQRRHQRRPHYLTQ